MLSIIQHSPVPLHAASVAVTLRKKTASPPSDQTGRAASGSPHSSLRFDAQAPPRRDYRALLRRLRALSCRRERIEAFDSGFFEARQFVCARHVCKTLFPEKRGKFPVPQ